MSNVFKHPDFKVEALYIDQKRQAAIAYLGDKWLLAKPVQRKTPFKEKK